MLLSRLKRREGWEKQERSESNLHGLGSGSKRGEVAHDIKIL